MALSKKWHTVSVWNPKSAKIRMDDSSVFRQLLASKNRQTQLSKIWIHFSAIKPLQSWLLSRFWTIYHLDFKHCLKSTCAVNWMQTSYPKSGRVWISDTHCTSWIFREGGMFYLHDHSKAASLTSFMGDIFYDHQIIIHKAPRVPTYNILLGTKKEFRNFQFLSSFLLRLI